MRIGMQPLQTECLLGQPFAEGFGQALAHLRRGLFDLGHGAARQVFQHQHTGPAEFARGKGNADARPVAEVLAEGFEVGALGLVVEFLSNGPLQLDIHRIETRGRRAEQSPERHQAA